MTAQDATGYRLQLQLKTSCHKDRASLGHKDRVSLGHKDGVSLGHKDRVSLGHKDRVSLGHSHSASRFQTPQKNFNLLIL